MITRLLARSTGVVALGIAAASLAPPGANAAQQRRPEGTGEGYVYTVGTGDLLRIAVWREPELTTDVRVRLDGRISVPLLGDLHAEGRPLDQLTSEIRTLLLRYVEVPQVTVTVIEALSARFFVLGEVVNSGVYPLNGRTSVIQALALAGGFREFAKRESIVIIRENPAGAQAIRFDYREVEAGRRLEQNIPLEPGDTILVP